MVYDVKIVRSFRELMETSVDDYASKCAFALKNADGSVREVSYTEAYNDIKALSTALLQKYDGKKIAVVGRNCYEWAITYLAVTCGAMVIVPVDKELKAPEINNVLSTAGVSAVIYMDGMKPTLDLCAHPCDRIPQSELHGLIAEGKRLLRAGDDMYETHRPDPDALSVLVFTSGTSGMARGVMLSQYNICSNIIGVMKQVRVTPEDRVLSILPLHHTYECMSGFLTMMYSGASIAYLENLRKIVSDMQLYKPTIFIVVPLILETLYKGIQKKISATKSGKLAFGAGQLITRATGALGIDVRQKVYGQIFDTFGGKLTKFLVGAAPLDPELFRAITDLGFTVYCGYGLTETSPVCIMHNDFYRSADNMGPALSGVTVRLDSPDENGVGEIAVKGPNVMLGYYNDPDATAAVIRDGWFYTGDLGIDDGEGHYKIVGRSKNMIVTKNGKKIFPEETEYKLTQTPYVYEAFVYGTPSPDGDVIVTAEIYPASDVIDPILAADGVTPSSPNYSERVKALVESAVKTVNKSSPAYKMIKLTVIRDTEFEKTTTKKIKRYKK